MKALGKFRIGLAVESRPMSGDRPTRDDAILIDVEAIDETAAVARVGEALTRMTATTAGHSFTAVWNDDDMPPMPGMKKWTCHGCEARTWVAPGEGQVFCLGCNSWKKTDDPDVCHPGAACSKPETRSKLTPDLLCPTCPDVERAHTTMLANLTATQKRCTELVEELRAERAKSSGPALTVPLTLRAVSGNANVTWRGTRGRSTTRLELTGDNGETVVVSGATTLFLGHDPDSFKRRLVLTPEHQDVTAMRERAEKAEADAMSAASQRDGARGEAIHLKDELSVARRHRDEAKAELSKMRDLRLALAKAESDSKSFGEMLHRTRSKLEGMEAGLEQVIKHAVSVVLTTERQYIAGKLEYVCGPWSAWLRRRIAAQTGAGEPDQPEQDPKGAPT